MNKWARRQEKVKMAFKSATAFSEPVQIPTSSKAMDSVVQPKKADSVKKPWDDGDDEEVDAAVEHPLPVGRMRNVGLPLNYQQQTFNTPINDPQRVDSESGGDVARKHFDEEQFVDREKRTCLLCRRQFPNAETLNKHLQLSDLHKANLATKLKEFRQAQAEPSVNNCNIDLTLQYRDRARERRQMHGYDPIGLTDEKESDFSDPKDTEALASFKAKAPLDASNIGNRMLKSMGWSEGQGLGRNAQGILNPLTADQRVQGVGLGATGSKVAYGTSRRERLKQAAIQRFNELE